MIVKTIGKRVLTSILSSLLFLRTSIYIKNND